jgi:hypothetical protein
MPAVYVNPEPVAAAPIHAEPVDDDYPEPPPRRRRGEEEEYHEEDEGYARRRGAGFTPAARAKVGLLIVFIAFCVVAGAFAFDFIGYVIASVQLLQALTGSRGGGGIGTASALETMFKIGAILAICGTLTAIVGYVFCMIGPNKRGSMGVAIATLAVAAIGLVVSIIFKVLPMFGEFSLLRGPGSSTSPFFGWFMMLLTQLFFCAEIIIFPFYTRALALARKKYWVADSSTRVMVIGIAYTVVRVLGWIIIYVMGQARSEGLVKAMGWIFLLLLWGGTALYITQLVQYLLLLWRARPIVK